MTKLEIGLSYHFFLPTFKCQWRWHCLGQIQSNVHLGYDRGRNRIYRAKHCWNFLSPRHRWPFASSNFPIRLYLQPWNPYLLWRRPSSRVIFVYSDNLLQTIFCEMILFVFLITQRRRQNVSHGNTSLSSAAWQLPASVNQSWEKYFFCSSLWEWSILHLETIFVLLPASFNQSWTNGHLCSLHR